MTVEAQPARAMAAVVARAAKAPRALQKGMIGPGFELSAPELICQDYMDIAVTVVPRPKPGHA
ncbi:hypothetical protein D3C87_1996640 [compost metagenome]